MTRAAGVAIFAALKKGPVSVATLSKMTCVEESCIREWLYAMRDARLVRQNGRALNAGKRRNKKAGLWELLPLDEADVNPAAKWHP